ncbi:MAG: MotA/TolQ/ExbB proton channel family protein [Thermoguttaceae bacterium]|nr:MotA/TolQ/ExbB proton channel family protein [Thermoguttaceae bacterium]
MKFLTVRLSILLLTGAFAAAFLFPPAAAAADPAAGSVSQTFLDLIKAGGIIGLAIFLLSLWGGAEAIRLFVLLRRERVIPSDLIEEARQASAAGAFHSIPDLCRRRPSFLASVLLSGLRNAAEGWAETEKGLEEGLEAETARLYRKTDFLALVGSIAPMLGLLGTVLGMLRAFGELAVSEGLGRFANLAQGIYLALVTTVDGLFAAIPALALCAFFNHRIAELVSDSAETLESLSRPLKEYLLRRSSAGSNAEPPRPPELPRVRARKTEN